MENNLVYDLEKLYDLEKKDLDMKTWKKYIIEQTDNLSFIKTQCELRVISVEDFLKNGNKNFKNSKLKIKDLVPIKTFLHLY